MTADGDIAVVEGGLDADGRPAPGARELARDPGPRPDQRRDRPPADRRAARPTAAARRRRARPRPPSDRSRSAGWTRAPSCSALLGSAEPRRRATRSSTSTTRRSGRTPSPARAAAPPSCGSRARRKALVATTDGNQAVGALDPWLGAALSVAEATRNVSITGARPLGVTNCLNYGDPTRPEAFWQLTEGVRGLADACRALGLPVTGGNVSLYNESPAGADRADARDRRGRPARRRRHARRAGVRGDRRRRSCSSARPSRASPAPPTRRSPATAAEDGPPVLDLAREAAAPGVHPRGDRARARRVGAGRVGRRARGRARRMRDVGRPRGDASASPVAHSPAVDLFGESPSRLVVTLPAALRAGARAARPPARPAGRGARHGRRRPPRHRARRGRRDRRGRGARQPRRRRARGPARATCATPGSTGSPRALGWEG